MIYKLFYKIIFLLSQKENFYGVLIYIPKFAPENVKQTSIYKIQKALSLIKKYRPSVISELSSGVEGILIFGNQGHLGRYVSSMSYIELYDNYIICSDTSIELLASLIVHEAQHVRLDRLGFTYKEYERERIENICKKAELVFGKRIPNGDGVVARAIRQIEADTANSYTDIAYKNRQFEALNYHLNSLNCPKWLIKTINWIVIKKTKSNYT